MPPRQGVSQATGGPASRRTVGGLDCKAEANSLLPKSLLGGSTNKQLHSAMVGRVSCESEMRALSLAEMIKGGATAETVEADQACSTLHEDSEHAQDIGDLCCND